ncbi:MAG: hypothetical protein KDA28_14585, partial [Phycisphaerales bacterium]|nr:hypothetical protein [Phycisphaerales bacterium]
FEVIDAAPGQVPAGAEVALPRAALFNAAMVRQTMAERADALRVFVTDVSLPTTPVAHEADMQMVDL